MPKANLTTYLHLPNLLQQGQIQGGGGGMGVATPPNDFKKPRPSWSEV